MSDRHIRRIGCLAICGCLLLPSCASRSVASGAAVGKAGAGLSTRAHNTPQGARACELQEALTATPPGTPDKPKSDACAEALNRDLLWRRSMVVLSAYSQKLDALASGGSPETSGKLEAAMTGIRGEDWIEVPASEQSARTAAAKLVAQMEAKDEKADLDKTVSDAAPYVKTLCAGLRGYLDAQATKFAEVRGAIEQKRAAKTDRRCVTFDNRTVCVSESAVDRVLYAGAINDLTMQEINHLEARDDVASFCAAHAKLETAAGSGDSSKSETHGGIVDAVKAVPRAKPPKLPAPEASDKK
jgi:hypothetical protein